MAATSGMILEQFPCASLLKVLLTVSCAVKLATKESGESLPHVGRISNIRYKQTRGMTVTSGMNFEFYPHNYIQKISIIRNLPLIF
jgi:hypothetical protein